MVSLVAQTTPFMARAASKLRCEVAKASQMQVRVISTAKTKLIVRRPNMLLRGTITKLATPRVMTVIPVSIASWLLLR